MANNPYKKKTNVSAPTPNDQLRARLRKAQAEGNEAEVRGRALKAGTPLNVVQQQSAIARQERAGKNYQEALKTVKAAEKEAERGRGRAAGASAQASGPNYAAPNFKTGGKAPKKIQLSETLMVGDSVKGQTSTNQVRYQVTQNNKVRTFNTKETAEKFIQRVTKPDTTQASAVIGNLTTLMSAYVEPPDYRKPLPKTLGQVPIQAQDQIKDTRQKPNVKAGSIGRSLSDVNKELQTISETSPLRYVPPFGASFGAVREGAVLLSSVINLSEGAKNWLPWVKKKDRGVDITEARTTVGEGIQGLIEGYGDKQAIKNAQNKIGLQIQRQGPFVTAGEIGTYALPLGKTKFGVKSVEVLSTGLQPKTVYSGIIIKNTPIIGVQEGKLGLGFKPERVKWSEIATGDLVGDTRYAGEIAKQKGITATILSKKSLDFAESSGQISPIAKERALASIAFAKEAKKTKSGVLEGLGKLPVKGLTQKQADELEDFVTGLQSEGLAGTSHGSVSTRAHISEPLRQRGGTVLQLGDYDISPVIAKRSLLDRIRRRPEPSIQDTRSNAIKKFEGFQKTFSLEEGQRLQISGSVKGSKNIGLELIENNRKKKIAEFVFQSDTPSEYGLETSGKILDMKVPKGADTLPSGMKVTQENYQLLTNIKQVLSLQRGPKSMTFYPDRGREKDIIRPYWIGKQKALSSGKKSLNIKAEEYRRLYPELKFENPIDIGKITLEPPASKSSRIIEGGSKAIEKGSPSIISASSLGSKLPDETWEDIIEQFITPITQPIVQIPDKIRNRLDTTTGANIKFDDIEESKTLGFRIQGNTRDIFLNPVEPRLRKYQEDKIVKIINHENLHNILEKKVGVKISSDMDNIAYRDKDTIYKMGKLFEDDSVRKTKSPQSSILRTEDSSRITSTKPVNKYDSITSRQKRASSSRYDIPTRNTSRYNTSSPPVRQSVLSRPSRIRPKSITIKSPPSNIPVSNIPKPIVTKPTSTKPPSSRPSITSGRITTLRNFSGRTGRPLLADKAASMITTSRKPAVAALLLTRDKSKKRKDEEEKLHPFIGNVPLKEISGVYRKRKETTYGKKYVSKFTAFDDRQSKKRRADMLGTNKRKKGFII